MMYAFMTVFSLSGVTVPALQSIIARYVPNNEQGELQGSLVSLGSLSAVFAPLVFTYLFVMFSQPHTPIYFPGAAYLAASGICLLAAVIWKFRSRED